MRSGVLTILILCSGISLGGNAPKVIHATRVRGHIVPDGLLHDPQWHSALPVSDFTQYSPREGSSPTESTVVRILYDDEAIYVGVICYDADPHGIVSQLTRRDRSSEADRFTVQIDSYNDRQTAFVFTTNVAGVQSDGILSQGGSVYDLNYDAVWNVKTARHRNGWSAEFEIPYNAIRFSPQDDKAYEWGINFRRYISRKSETIEWVMVPSTETLQIDKWGHVDGIANIAASIHLSVIPYLSALASFETASPYRQYRSARSAHAGLDIKYGISRNFTLDAAFNPDFGQVEVDQSVLNLTVFETFYPEKRPFFVEGASLFEFGNAGEDPPLRLFFSRRIGQRPRGSDNIVAQPGERVEENPHTTTILGAAKLSGRTESGFSVGLLASITGEENATVISDLGTTRRIRTEPAGSYDILRVRQEFGDNSGVGAIATLAGRENVLPAISGGIDWNVRFAEGDYTLDGYLAGAHASDTIANPDGGAGKILFSRIAAEHWFYTLSYNFFSANFNCNDLGFLNEPRYHGGYALLTYREPSAAMWFHRWALSIALEGRWNWDQARTLATIDASFSADWTNFWRSTLRFSIDDRAYDDKESGINGLYLRPAHSLVEFSTTTAEQKPVSVSLTTHYAFDEKRRSGLGVQLSATLRPTPWIELRTSLTFERVTNEETGVFDFNSGAIAVDTSEQRRSLIGERDLESIDVALSGIVTFTRSLSLQFSTQILMPRGRYDNIRSLAGSETLIPSARQNFDFNESNLIANVLFRWEFLPGSTAYLVWTQSRSEWLNSYDPAFGPRLRSTFKLPHDDAVLLKVSYWLPL